MIVVVFYTHYQPIYYEISYCTQDIYATYYTTSNKAYSYR